MTQIEIMTKAIKDFEFFCKCLTIQSFDMNKAPGAKNILRDQPFVLKKHQKEFIKFIEEPTQPNEKIVLKARQIGITEVLMAYCLWKLLYRKEFQNYLYY